jgi:hypothetical protein
MIDPKHSLQILRPGAQTVPPSPEEEGSTEEEQAPTIAHDEPETPIHSDLEYEILYEGEDSSTSFVPTLRIPSTRRKRSMKNDVKLLISFVCLVVFG